MRTNFAGKGGKRYKSGVQNRIREKVEPWLLKRKRKDLSPSFGAGWPSQMKSNQGGEKIGGPCATSKNVLRRDSTGSRNLWWGRGKEKRGVYFRKGPSLDVA